MLCVQAPWDSDSSGDEGVEHHVSGATGEWWTKPSVVYA